MHPGKIIRSAFLAVTLTAAAGFPLVADAQGGPGLGGHMGAGGHMGGGGHMGAGGGVGGHMGGMNHGGNAGMGGGMGARSMGAGGMGARGIGTGGMGTRFGTTGFARTGGHFGGAAHFRGGGAAMRLNSGRVHLGVGVARPYIGGRSFHRSRGYAVTPFRPSVVARHHRARPFISRPAYRLRHHHGLRHRGLYPHLYGWNTPYRAHRCPRGFHWSWRLHRCRRHR